MSLRAQVGALVTELRGDVSRAEVARALGVTRPAVSQVEAGSLSLDRLDKIGEVYLVRFELVAVDPATGDQITGPAPRWAQE